MSPSGSTALASSTPQRDADIWFEDGSIVLVASHTTAFRIFKSLLAYHATIFNDMFSLGHSEEAIDNVPVVHLADPPDALRIFLLLLMSSGYSTPRWSHPKLPEQLPFSTFDGLMRIVHKYEATRVLPMLSNLLGSIALVSRDGLWGKDRVCLPTTEADAFPIAVLVSDDDAIEALELARCVGADDAVVAAMLWQCCLRGPIFLRDGVTREGGVVRRLSEDDYVRCVIALPRVLLSRRDIVLRTMQYTNAALFAHCERPSYREDCKVYINALALKYARDPPPIGLESRPPAGKDNGVWDGAWLHPRDGLCAKCQRHSLQLLKDAFDVYWRQDLPKLFKL